MDRQGNGRSRPAVSKVNRRGGLPLPAVSFYKQVGFRVRSAEYLLMHSYGVHRRDGEHTLFKEGVKHIIPQPLAL